MADKQDEILAAVNQLIPQVQATNVGVEKANTEITNIRIEFARYQEKHENLEGHVDAIGQKLREHAGDSTKHPPMPPLPSTPVPIPIPDKPEPDHWTGATKRWRFVMTVAMAIGAVIGVLSYFAPLIVKAFQ